MNTVTEIPKKVRRLPRRIPVRELHVGSQIVSNVRKDGTILKTYRVDRLTPCTQPNMVHVNTSQCFHLAGFVDVDIP